MTEEKAEVVFEKGLGGFIPMDKVTDEELLGAIEKLVDEALKRKVRKDLEVLLSKVKKK